jgi:hypothetical protein
MSGLQNCCQCSFSKLLLPASSWKLHCPANRLGSHLV